MLRQEVVAAQSSSHCWVLFVGRSMVEMISSPKIHPGVPIQPEGGADVGETGIDDVGEVELGLDIDDAGIVKATEELTDTDVDKLGEAKDETEIVEGTTVLSTAVV